MERPGESADGESTCCTEPGVDGCVEASGFRDGLVRCTTDIVRTCRFVFDATDGARFSGEMDPGGRLWCRAVRTFEGVLGVDITMGSSRSIDLSGNEDGGALDRRAVAGTLLFATSVEPDIVLLLFGTTVVVPLTALLRDTIDDALDLVTPDDMPAVVEYDVLRVIRDGVSEGGLEVIRGIGQKETERK